LGDAAITIGSILLGGEIGTAIRGSKLSSAAALGRLENLDAIDVISSFKGVTVKELTEDLLVYRYWGGGTRESGAWFSANPVSDPINQLALPLGNIANNISGVTKPKGTTILEGSTAPKFGRPGGARQIFVPGW
jgi:hypothetical protein